MSVDLPGGVAWVVGLTLLVGTTLMLAQAPEGAALVTVDFLATDAGGHPVEDLRDEEVSLRVGGRPVSLVSLRRLAAAGGRGSFSGPALQLPVEHPEATAFERRFLLVIDEESIPAGSGQSTREAVRAFVERLGPADRIGLALVPRGQTRVEMTTQHQAVLAALQGFSGRGSTAESANDAACRARLVLTAITSLQAAAADPGGPLVLIFFSGSLVGGGAVGLPLGASLACDVQLNEFREVGFQAARSRTYFYIVQPETFAGEGWPSSPRAGLEQLAGVTAGRIVQLTGRDRDVLDRVSSETGALYLGRTRVSTSGPALQTLSVRVSRPGVRVFARPHVDRARGNGLSR